MSTEYLCIFLILIFQQLFSFLHAYLIIVLLDLLLSIFFLLVMIQMVQFLIFLKTLFLAVLGFCCTQAFSSSDEQGLPFVMVHRLLDAVASLVGSTGSRLESSLIVACSPQSVYSVGVVHRLQLPTACGIFLGQGSNLCPLHQQADFLSTVPPRKSCF